MNKKTNSFILKISTMVALALLSVYPVKAQSSQDPIKGIITNEVETKEIEFNGTIITEQVLEVKITNQNDTLETIQAISASDSALYKVGDEVLVVETEVGPNQTQYFVADSWRTPKIYYLLGIFIVVVLLVSKWHGLMSLLGMVYSFFIIISFLLPRLLEAQSPIATTLLAIVLIAPVTFFLSHGYNKKTLVALFSALLALVLTSSLATVFINITNITGLGSEEAAYLQTIFQGQLNIKGLLLAGIIIGTLGILDDATVTQSSIVSRLKKNNKKLTPTQTFKEAMHVGHDHIASTVNTLILVYTGAALPLLLLFVKANQSFDIIINTQIVAEELITMLVSSIGLIISIPITTFIASHLLTGNETDEHFHDH